MLVRFNPKTDLRIDSVVKYDLRLSRANITFHIPSILLPSSSSCCSFLVTVHIYVFYCRTDETQQVRSCFVLWLFCKDDHPTMV
ncbi:hypothetical protein E1A91_D05G016400v1 [Gossypium mustelinum]|uniref:Uncharacterized protein n=1 Tax=Gossypium mustelinum TaxID=34275 RepID=A0A5D2URE9_GOSMU|nr:hypothetical protein E1A91_D05G016400v1 [Gossypium mustelinum]